MNYLPWIFVAIIFVAYKIICKEQDAREEALVAQDYWPDEVET